MKYKNEHDAEMGLFHLSNYPEKAVSRERNRGNSSCKILQCLVTQFLLTPIMVLFQIS